MPDVYSDKLKLRLTKIEAGRLGKQLLNQIEDSRLRMSDMFSDMLEGDKHYESRLPGKDFPWKDCSNVCVPLTQWVVDTFVARLSDVILAVSPITQVQPPPEIADEPQAKVVAKRVERLLDAMESQRMDLPRVIAEEIVPAALRTPAAITQVAWREEWRTVREEVPDTDIWTGEQTTKISEKREVAYRGPKPEFVDIRNFVIYPLTAKSIETAAMVGHRYRVTEDDIRRKVKDGLWNKEALELIDRMNTESSDLEDSETDELEDYIGIERSSEFRQMWFWEVITGYPGKDGLNEDCLFTLEAETGQIVRATKLPYFHGMRHYVDAKAFPRYGYFFGRTVPGILRDCQRELNAIHNQRVDSTSLAISKPFIVANSRDAEAEDIEIHPGAEIRVNSLDEVQELDISPNVPGIDVEAVIRDYAERATGVNDVSLGRQTEGDKTATEVGIVNAEGGVRFGNVINSVQRGIVQIGKQVLGLCRQFMSDEELARYEITRQDLMVDWVLMPHGNLGTANRMQQRQEADIVYRTMLGGAGSPPNPLVVSSPSRVHKITDDYLQAFGRTETDDYIGTSDEAKMLEQAAQQQMEAEAQAQQMQQAEMQAQQQMQMQQESMRSEQERGDKMSESQANRDNQLMVAAMRKQGQGQ